MAVPGTGISAQVAIPYVEIINCCDSSDRGFFNIDGFDPITFQDGVYNYTGPGFATPQITFITGNCYTIVNPGNSGTPYFPIPPVQWANFNLTSTDVEKGCLDCIDCNPSLTKLVFTSCCNQSVVQTQGQLPFGTTQWIIKYTGPLVNGFDNKCYVVTQVDNVSPTEHATLPPTPVNGTYVLISNDPKAECSDYPVPECPACEDPKCYTVINCDGVYFNTWEDLSAYVGQFIEIDNRPGSWYVSLNSGSCRNAEISTPVLGLAEPCPCLCYEVVGTLKSLQYVNCDNEIVKDATATKFCSRIFPIFSGTAGQYQILQGEECVDGLCPLVCYKLTNCDTKEVIYSTLQTLSQYVNTSSVVTLLGYEGCWEVDESTATNCDCITVTIEDRSGVNQYTATLITPYNGWNRWTFTIGTDNYFIWNASLNPSTNWTISKNSSGPIPGPTYAESKFSGDCPETISDGSLTGWVIQEVPWINVQTEKCPGPCDCPVDVTILQDFSSCQTCEPIIAYKLQNCEKIYEVQYTTQDLSAYVNQVIETDCGCFTVQQINYVPPSETLIVIDNSFKTCNECLSTYYLLTDCAGEAVDIVTKTNLANYVGKVIKIENCDVCWEVSTTRTFTELSNVVVLQDFETCEACGTNLPCICSTITNYSEEVKTYTYLNCDKQYETITLQPHQTSDRICVLKWVPNDDCCIINTYTVNSEGEIETFVWKYEETQEVINGKPVYEANLYNNNNGREILFKLFYQNGCWYQFSNAVDTAAVLPFKLCQDSDCPIGTWELLDCYCLGATVQGDQLGLFFNLYISDIDQNGYNIYTAGQYTVTYNLELERWELYIEGSELVQAYLESTNPCPLSGESRAVTFISVALDGTFTIENECKNETIFTNNTSSCGIECQCINSTLTAVGDPYRFSQNAVLQPTGNIVNGKPEYFVQFYDEYKILYIYWDPNTNCWILSTGNINAKAAAPSILATLCNSINPNCPIGTWSIPTFARAKADAPVLTITDFVTEYCTDGTSNNEEDPNTDPFTYIQFFGECQHGVCPPPVFKNNRTVRPGYNTPICTPAKYDEITCRFADIMYKVVLEKRYGITNCCPDEDDKWLIKKELIDLQALKDPNYNCPDCPCSCNSGKTCSTCNCKN